MFCGQCGTRLEPGVKFCPNCGERCEENELPAASEASAYAAAEAPAFAEPVTPAYAEPETPTCEAPMFAEPVTPAYAEPETPTCDAPASVACPVCGTGGQPADQSRCWVCGAELNPRPAPTYEASPAPDEAPSPLLGNLSRRVAPQTAAPRPEPVAVPSPAPYAQPNPEPYASPNPTPYAQPNPAPYAQPNPRADRPVSYPGASTAPRAAAPGRPIPASGSGNSSWCMICCILLGLATAWYLFVGIGYFTGWTYDILFGAKYFSYSGLIDVMKLAFAFASGDAILEMIALVWLVIIGGVLILCALLNILTIVRLYQHSIKAKKAGFVFFSYILLQGLTLGALAVFSSGLDWFNPIFFIVDVVLNLGLGITVTALIKQHEHELR